jgi:hypothetical protein
MNQETQQEISLLNLRVNDMMTQLNKALKTLVDENTRLTQQIESQKNPKRNDNQPECEVKKHAD